jgi:hemolysin activation/secretion protein
MSKALHPARILAGFFSFPLLVVAAAMPPDQILRNEQQRIEQQREEQQRRPDVFIPPVTAGKPATPTPAAGPCFTVHTIHLDGAPAAWLHWLQPIADQAAGKCLDLAAINQLVGALTDEIVAKGYVTSRVYVPEQQLQSGILRLVVVPGRIQGIRLQDGGSDLSLRSAFPSGPGDILNVRDLEQGLEQLDRPTSQQATMELLPGDNPGETIVQVKRQRQRPVHLQLGEDDSGQVPTGKNQLSGQISADNLIGINDVLSISQAQDAAETAHPRSRSQSVSWLLPWGNWSAYASYSAFDYRQTVTGLTQDFQSSGQSRNTYLSLSRLLNRNQTSKTELALQLTRKAVRSFIEDAEIVSQRQDLSYLGLELSRRQYLGQASLDMAISVTRGLDIWGAQADTLVDQGGPSARPEIYGARLNLNLPIQVGRQQLAYTGVIKGQYSPHRLFGTDQFSIGSRTTVRGYDANSLAAQSGWFWRNDLAWPLLQGDRRLETYLGLDVGQVSGATTTAIDHKRLSGWAVGVRGGWSRYLSAEISHEQPLRQPGGWKRQSITHFNLICQW